MTSAIPWVGRKRIAFVPVFRRLPPTPLPDDWRRDILRRVFNDPQPHAGNADFSLRAWIRAASAGKADIEPVVLPIQTVDGPGVDTAALARTLEDSLRQQGIDGAAFVGTTGIGATNWGFWSEISMDHTNGAWLMEILHGVTGVVDFGHFGNDVDPANRSISCYDHMADATQVHPTVYTKHEMGWVDEAAIAVHGAEPVEYVLQHVSLTQPLADGRVAAVRIGVEIPYLMAESRRRTDQFEAGFENGGERIGGICQEGVIVYRVQVRDPTNRDDREGFRKPLYLETLRPLTTGQSLVLANGVRVAALAEDATGASIRIDIAGRSARPAVGSPRAITFDDARTSIVFHRDGAGHVHEIWRDEQGEGAGDLTFTAGAPPTVGTPFGYHDPSGDQVIVLFRSGDGHVRSLYGKRGVPTRTEDLTAALTAPRAAGDPVGWYSLHDQYQHVAYRGDDGRLRELWWKERGDSGHSDLTSLARGSLAAGDPWPYYDAARSTNVVTFRGADGRIRSFYWSNGGVGEDDLSGIAGTPQAAGDPFAWYSAVDDTHHIVYRGVDGHVYELHSQGQDVVRGRDLTVLTGAPPAASDLSGGDHTTDGTRKVIYCSADGGLHELWYRRGESTVHHANLTLSHNAALATTDRPIYFRSRRQPRQHVTYRAADGHIREVRW